jgi:Flp pilus assembly protein TadD
MTFRLSALAPVLTAGLLAACAGGLLPERDIGQAVEPSLRAAAANAEAAHDYQGAAQHWGTIYQRRPDDREVALNLARMLRYGGQPQQGADLMQAHLARHPGDAGLLTELGKDYLAADRVGLAIKALEEARTTTGAAWDSHATLGVALDTQGRTAEAADAYARALELSPGNAAVLNNYALSLALAGKLDDAVAMLRQAAELPASGTQVRQNLALLLALKGDGAQAERLAGHDLPPEVARGNVEILKALAAAARGS